jgi:ribosome-associated toxin RatA of RatAB toxin-antitoxin module
MVSLKDSIIINKPVWEVYRICADIENHPKFIPYFKKCEIIEKDDNHVLVKRTAEINGKLQSWLGLINFVEKNTRFRFRQVDGPLKGMTGDWIFESVPEGTMLTITHNISFKMPIIGRFMEIYAANRFVSKSARNTLESLKENIEKKR